MNIKFKKPEDFYRVYSDQRTYIEPYVRKKHIRNFDQQFWQPAKADTKHSVLELGCGTGLFLAYLDAKKVESFAGIDSDPNVLEFMTDKISKRVIIADLWEFIENNEIIYDRIVMLDVFEHFSQYEGGELLSLLKGNLSDNGKIVLRIPNVSSPFGLQYQYGDLTHKAAYGPGSIQHLALSAGYEMESCLSVQRGNRIKRFLETQLFKLVGCFLTEPPRIWGGNMIVVLSPKRDT